MAARLRLRDAPRDVPTATELALRSVTRRYQALSREIAQLDAQIIRCLKLYVAREVYRVLVPCVACSSPIRP
jgi:hypothetical protein